MKYTCPCCDYKTFDEPVIGTFNICVLCGWEDDLIQNVNPDYVSGPNGICLREAQYEFLNAATTTEGFVKDPSWKILEPPSNKMPLKGSTINFIVSANGDSKKCK